MPEGYVALASITILRRSDGSPDFRSFGQERWCTLQLEVIGSNYNRRRMRHRMYIEAAPQLRRATGLAVLDWLSCFESRPTDLRISRLDGLIVPFKASVERQPTWKRKAVCSRAKRVGSL